MNRRIKCHGNFDEKLTEVCTPKAPSLRKSLEILELHKTAEK